MVIRSTTKEADSVMAALVAEDLTTSTDLRGIGAPTPAPEGRRSHPGMGTDSCGFLGH